MYTFYLLQDQEDSENVGVAPNIETARRYRHDMADGDSGLYEKIAVERLTVESLDWQTVAELLCGAATGTLMDAEPVDLNAAEED